MTEHLVLIYSTAWNHMHIDTCEERGQNACIARGRNETKTARFMNETRAVHEWKPRLEICLGQMDEGPTQKDLSAIVIFIVFISMDFFSHLQLAHSIFSNYMQISF